MLLSSCGMKSCLDNRDYDWLVYTKGDSLFYESNLGSLDTVEIIRKHISFKGYSSLPDGFYNPEIAIINYSSSRNKDEKRFIELNSQGWFEDSRLNINLYGESFSNGESFSYASDKFIETNKTYNFGSKELKDIILIISGDTTRRGKSINKIWWSKSTGIIQYESCEGELWKLEKWKKSNKK